MRVSLEVSAGELVDRITILELKCAFLPPSVRDELVRELSAANAERDRSMPPSIALSAFTEELRAVNHELWRTEEELRACERSSDFGARFA